MAEGSNLIDALEKRINRIEQDRDRLEREKADILEWSKHDKEARLKLEQEVERLEKRVGELEPAQTAAMVRIVLLGREVKTVTDEAVRLREAAEFYGDEDNWYGVISPEEAHNITQKAREALPADRLVQGTGIIACSLHGKPYDSCEDCEAIDGLAADREPGVWTKEEIEAAKRRSERLTKEIGWGERKGHAED